MSLAPEGHFCHHLEGCPPALQTTIPRGMMTSGSHQIPCRSLTGLAVFRALLTAVSEEEVLGVAWQTAGTE